MRKPLKLFGRIINPLIALIGIQLAWVLVVLVWIRWFLGNQQTLRAVAERYSPEFLDNNLNWFLLAEGLLLLILILVGAYVIFLYWRRQVALYREQKKFISQVTHELKSPLASLQLHLETIKRRKPSPGKLDEFVDTMLSDTRRLHGLINNMLTANRLELKGPRLLLKKSNLSNFVQHYFNENGKKLPSDTELKTDIEPNLYSRFEAESLEIVLRNILENAVVYSDGPARIRVSLSADDHRCHLVVTDQGRGLDEVERKKVFRMFYRAERGNERIPGTGLGLFISRAIIARHRGKIRIESAGPGQGCSVHITLPRVMETR